MLLYHGTDIDSAKSICDKIILGRNSSENLDFGPGFYTTTSKESAIIWAFRKASVRRKEAALVTINFNYDIALADSKIVVFDNDLRWGRFIINNRNGYGYIDKVSFKEHNLDSRYHITYGRIADYDIWEVAEELDKSDELLSTTDKILNPFYSYQYAFHTQDSLSYIGERIYEIIKEA